MSGLTNEILNELYKPFSPDVVQWKPGPISRDGNKALALAYADSRAYYDRLDQSVGGDWADDYEVSPDGQRVVCRLTVAGVTRCDVGECEPTDKNTTTTAAAQAFKRACAKFGLGRYLYALPSYWVEYDSQSRRFTDGAIANLYRIAKQVNAQSVNTQSEENTIVFESVGAAVAWGFDQGVFKTKQEAKQIYNKCKAEKKPENAEQMGAFWRAEVLNRINGGQ